MHITRFMRLTQLGRLLPLYSSNTETYAHSCSLLNFAAIVVLGDTWKEQQDFAEPHLVHSQLKGAQRCSRRSYKNPVLAIGLSQFFGRKRQIAHAVPQDSLAGKSFVPYMKGWLVSLRWSSDWTKLISSRVSRRLRIWKKAFYACCVNYAIYSNYAGVYQYKQKQWHLEWFEHSMHVDLTPIFGQRMNAQAGIGFSMVLKKISTQLVRQHRQYFVRLIVPAFAMQNWFPWNCSIAQIMLSTTCQTMR